jgi:hypothetical protein
MDLFENYTDQPKELQTICDKWADKQASEGLSYKDCEDFLKEVELIGYTFDSGLDAEPFNLRETDEFITSVLTSDITEEDTDFVVNENLTINDFDYPNDQIVEFMKHGEMQPYKAFTGTIKGAKVKGFVCLNDDNIYRLEYNV